jgi:hypothetical protein
MYVHPSTVVDVPENVVSDAGVVVWQNAAELSKAVMRPVVTAERSRITIS